MAEQHHFQLFQGGQMVAEVWGHDRLTALGEIMHYAMVYSEDGLCEVKGVTPEDWSSYTANRPSPTGAVKP